MHYDVFNGDADGICALQQLRLHRPISESIPVTGVKRDINLLNRIVEQNPASIRVLDISLDKNREDLQKLLDRKVSILYIDHHFAGAIPESSMLEHHIEASAETCTSFIVNSMLLGRFPFWAACGGFGDNLHTQATRLAKDAGADESEIEILKEIGELMNYNGYGSKEEDLHFHPAELLHRITPFVDPLEFFGKTDVIKTLRRGYDDDMARAMDIGDLSDRRTHRIYHLPNEPWSRRVSGVFSNLRARQNDTAAHAVITDNDDDTHVISVRAPLCSRKDADTLCRKFPTGGGRAAAAGINRLPAHMLDSFIETFYATFLPEA